jgi:soluble lytic murein transglycosylase-like protein
VQAAAARYDLAPELLDTVARQESGYRPAAVSPAGAVGLMQLMPATARALGVDPTDPVQSLNGAAAYLRSLLDRFDGRIDLALAAYNAGPAAVERYAGAPPYRETRAYVSANLDGLARLSLAPSSTPSPKGQP